MLMKKSNKILVGCLALLLVMAVGYALFSETITINGTATAKGEFKLAVSCQPGFNSDTISINQLADMHEIELPRVETGYSNDVCSVNNNIVSYSAELAYPGAVRYFTIKITNNGTMDAVINLDGGIELLDEIICSDSDSGNIIGTLEESECESIKNYHDYMNHLLELKASEPLIFQLEKADGTKLDLSDDDEDLSDFLNEDTDDLVLNPGNSVYFVAYTKIDEKAEPADNKMLASHSISYKFVFTQPTN